MEQDASLKQLFKEAIERVRAMSPEQQEAHFEAQKKAWVRAEMEMGDEGTRVIK